MTASERERLVTSALQNTQDGLSKIVRIYRVDADTVQHIARSLGISLQGRP